jgi:transcriptional regulator of arginine metabolism
VIDDVSPTVRVSRVAVLRQMVRSATGSGNLVVVKCGPGNAPAVGEALDHLNITEIIGTVAGDDTLLAVVREGVSGKRVADKFLKEIGLK